MTQTWRRCADDDAHCVVASDGLTLANRARCVDYAMALLVVYLCTNAVATNVWRVSYRMVVTICQPNKQANPRDEYNVDAYYGPNQQFHVCGVGIQCSLLIHLYDEFHHMILIVMKILKSWYEERKIQHRFNNKILFKKCKNVYKIFEFSFLLFFQFDENIPLYKVVTVPAAVWNGIHKAPVSLEFIRSVCQEKNEKFYKGFW